MMWSNDFKQKFMPLALRKCHVPLALWNVLTVAHPVSRVHKTADLLGSLGLSGAISFMLDISVFLG